MRFLDISAKKNRYNSLIYVIVLLACLVPRYISTLKIHLGLNISFFTIAVVAVAAITLRQIKIIKNIEFSFFWIWFAFIAVSVWRTEKIGVWGYYVDWVLTAVLLQQIIYRFGDENTYENIVRALTDALFLHLLMGIYEITTHRYLFETGNISRRLYGHVAIGMFYNLNDYATFVTTMLPFAIYRFRTTQKKIEKVYCAFLTMCSLYLIAISESRGAILTLMVFICGSIYVFATRSTKNKLITGAGLAAFIAAFVVNVGGVRASLVHVLDRNTIDLTGGTDIARLNLIKNGLYFLKQTHGFGVGAGNLYNWLAERSIYHIGDLLFIHNWYVEILVTFGVVFFILYVIFHGKILYKLYSQKYRTSSLKTTFFLSFVCFSIVSISSSSNVYSEWVWMYLVTVSLYTLSLRKMAE